ncbi:MAG: 16S rRNA (adenine(1518)-N(6)/adenine(1519)-N(6))-dimethyltransferase RsmA [Planctomycetota bacterium]|nr:16S rRNA (adenine(1518)-N(6)/adenine(1519)-N(6))-dimethyltransferase RsmA [Planctomycetota bacterium]
MPQSLTEIRELLQSRGLAPRKALGQNFLIDHNLVRKLVDASGIQAGDVVLEVGPGTGTLSLELLHRGARLTACELDRGLAELLRETIAPQFPETFTLIEGDCLASPRELAPELASALGGASGVTGETSTPPFTLVANLPYGAATPLMLILLTRYPACRGMYVTIQREVGDRLLGEPGNKDYGPLGVIVQAMARVRKVATLPPECFWPRPDVTSVMIGVERLESPLVEQARAAAFLDFCQLAFSQRRKQLGSVLGRSRAWPAGIEPTMRAEQLTAAELLALWNAGT